MQRGRRNAQTDAARARMRLGRQQVEAKLAQADTARRAQALRVTGYLEQGSGCAACSAGRHGQCLGLPCACLCYLGEEPEDA